MPYGGSGTLFFNPDTVRRVGGGRDRRRRYGRLTLGCALASGGVEVAVIDRVDPAELTGQAFDGRVSAIAFASMRALNTIGVWPKLLEPGGQIQPIHAIRVSMASLYCFFITTSAS